MIDKFESYFDSINIPQEFKISNCEYCYDLPKLITSHLSYLKANSGNRRYLAYYDRLHLIYNTLKNK